MTNRNEEQRKNRRDLSPTREVTLCCLQQQRRQQDRGAARIVADAHVLSDVGDFIDNVLDGHGGKSIEHESDFEHNQEHWVRTQKTVRKKNLKW